MSFLKRIFRFKQKTAAADKEGFWDWFSRHATEFHRIVNKDEQVDAAFLERLMPRLQSLNPQFYCLTGMYDDTTAELILTAEGDIKSFVFVEDLVAGAPVIKGWKFTALKPPTDIESFSLNMNDYTFNSSNIRFYYNDDAAYPDEIDISLLYDHYTEENKESVRQGCLLFVENSLGELNMAVQIDNITVAAGCPEGRESIPISKLGDFLSWREKELVEKYEGTLHAIDRETYSIMEAEDSNNLPVIAVINQDILEWEAKASHPWMMTIEISYDGTGRNGMPEKKVTEVMYQFEDELAPQLSDSEGYLYLGRETYNGKRTIFFACKEFRRVSKVTAALIGQYQGRLDISYDIYKDRYWMSLNQFRKARIL
jgi:hypothetical protein